MAMLLRQQGRSSEACSLHELEVEANRQAGIERSLGVSLTSLGVVERRLGDLESAERYFGESLEIAHRMGNGRSISINQNLLAEIDIRSGRLEKARQRIDEALASNRSTRDPRGRAYYLSALGDIACLAGDLEDARGKFDEALRIREAIGESDNATRSRLALATLSLDEGEAAEAVRGVAEVLEELPARADGDRAFALALEARALHALGKPEAVTSATRALALVEDLEDRETVLRIRLTHAVVTSSALEALDVADGAAVAGLVDVELGARLAAARLDEDESAWDAARDRAQELGLLILPSRYESLDPAG